MKHIFLFLCSVLALAACSSEDPITPRLTYGNDFVITDQPNDSIQHTRYLIYKDFGVPVYFNDTIAKHTEGIGVDGKPRTTYETVDLNWTFSGYNRGVKYSYVYLTAPEDQMRSVSFAAISVRFPNLCDLLASLWLTLSQPLRHTAHNNPLSTWDFAPLCLLKYARSQIPSK